MEVVRQAVNGAIIAKAILTRLQSSCLHISSHIFTSRLHSSCLHFTSSHSKAKEISPAKYPSQMFQMKQITKDCAQSRARVQSIHNYLRKLIFELTQIHVSIKILTKIRVSINFFDQNTCIHESWPKHMYPWKWLCLVPRPLSTERFDFLHHHDDAITPPSKRPPCSTSTYVTNDTWYV